MPTILDASTTEIEAFCFGVNLIKQFPRYTSVQIITDCSSILTQLSSTKILNQSLLESYLKLLDLSNYYNIMLSKVDSHTNILGNDIADSLAKCDSPFTTTENTIPIQCLKNTLDFLGLNLCLLC